MSSPPVSVYFLPRVGADRRPAARSKWRPLVAFVVAKKVSKSACKRNRARRRLREAYRLLRSEETKEKDGERGLGLDLDQWYAMVFVAHGRSLDASWEEMVGAVKSCLIRANKRYGRAKIAKSP